ncbi:hypothetical protein R3P38DRAFT_3388420 [Favolaschia claudopus]|uniref:Macrofage activating glycoprotein n=1 Tax=Favolaschia claudopus TaxID=2862362 RepID=A0AAW0D8Y7_9AGAR
MYNAIRTSKFSRFVLFLSVATTLAGVDAQKGTYPATPLASKHFPYPSGIPYQADSDDLIRGRQTGYNLCNSTTEGQASLCQTAFINDLDDFCVWAPRDPNSTIADTEGEEVAWCTKPGRGTRVFPPGALQGVQFMRTPDYVQVVGFVDQTLINIMAGDSGGELDPHGADLRGNPLGGLVYSTAWGGKGSWTQVIEWHNFMGGNQFCFKACDPSKPNAAKLCQHIYDRIGCRYNAPSNAKTGTFESCLGDNQDFPGIYTAPESLGPISTLPYDPKVPPSSSCTQYSSSQLYNVAGSPTSSGIVSATAPSHVSSLANGIGRTGDSMTNLIRSGAILSEAAVPSPTGTSQTSGAEAVSVGLVSSLLGVVLAVVFLA